MNVPPAATYRSRIANEVSSSVRVPISIAPRLSTLTDRWVPGSVPITRYFMKASLAHEARSKSNRNVKPDVKPESQTGRSNRKAQEVRHRTPDPRRIQPVQRRVVGRRAVPPQLRTPHAQAEQPVRPPRQGRRNRKRRRPGQIRLDQHHGWQSER